MTKPEQIQVVNGRGWRFEDDIYRAVVYLVQAPYDDFRRAMDAFDWGIQERTRMPLASTLVHETEAGAYHQAIWIPSDWNLYDVECLGTLVHECQHVTFHTLLHRGVNADQDSQEPFCYYLGSLFEKCLQALRSENGR